MTTASAAHADDFFSRFDRAMGSLESTVNRADGAISRMSDTAGRLNEKSPAAGGSSTPAQKAARPAAVNAEEERILEQARQIEEERVLQEAERIRARRKSR